VTLFESKDADIATDVDSSQYYVDYSASATSSNSIDKLATRKQAQATDDLELFARINAGDEPAMQELYQRYSGPLLHFIKNYIVSSDEADDVMHETMLEVWRRADRFEGRSSAKSWIFSIARNKSIDKNRKASKNVYVDIIPEALTDEPEPDMLLASINDAEYLRECVNRLSKAHRIVINLVFFQDLSYKEISEVLSCPVGTVKTRVLHAKRLLMHMLSQTRK